jgi:hypothetical protein
MTMTLDELRDAHAKRLGWRLVADDGNLQRTCWINELYNGCPITGRTIIVTKEGEDIHPIPATLDAIAGLMPPNWEWCMDVDVLEAYRDTTGYVWVERTGDELTDRARLAWLAWEAEAKGAAE